ncbi:MAG: SPOR domain-containing protein [Candidatus Nitrotoga sp.]
MRWLFWLLLLVNVGIFAFFQWGSLLTTANNSVQNQPGFNVEKIKLLDASAVLQMLPTVPVSSPPAPSTAELSAASVVSPNAAASAALATQPVAQPVQPVTRPVPASAPTQSVNRASSIPPAQIIASPPISPETQSPISVPLSTPATRAKTANKQCLEWGKFSGMELNRANAALDKLKLSEGLIQHQTNTANSYWVHVPPLESRDAANKKVVRFKKAGVRDIYVVQDPGRWQHAISLGLFKTEEAAHRYHAELRRKGVQSAVVGELANNIKITTFILKNMDKVSAAKVRKLHKDFFGSELKTIACN